MSNRVKDIFSSKKVGFGGDINFKDEQSKKKFMEALKIVESEGKTVKIDGVSSINTHAGYGEIRYPFMEQEKVIDVIVGPCIEEVPIMVNTKNGERTVMFNRYYTKNEIILKTNEKDIVYWEISFNKRECNYNFTYRIQPHLASTVKDIVESLSLSISLLGKLFENTVKEKDSDDYTAVAKMEDALLEYAEFYEKIYAIEKEFKIEFKPSKMKKDVYECEKITELFLLIIEKRVIRVNRKLTSSEFKGFERISDEPLEGKELCMSFFEENQFEIFGERIIIYTANLAKNCIVKEIKVDKNGNGKVLFGDTDSKPMYISYTGFKTIDEARDELENIIEKKQKKYETALTVDEYMEDKE